VEGDIAGDLLEMRSWKEVLCARGGNTTCGQPTLGAGIALRDWVCGGTHSGTGTALKGM